MSENEKIEVVVDTSAIERKIPAMIEAALKAKELERDDDGKGEEGGSPDDEYQKMCERVAENLKKGRSSLREEWSVAVPRTTLETAAHLRDFCAESNALSVPKPGNTVRIPVVKDVDLKLLAAVGDSTTQTSLLTSITADITENMAWSRVGYHEVEQYDSDVIDKINQVFAHAAIRGEDRRIINAILAKAATSFAYQALHQGVATDFVASWIPEAIGKLLAAGKEAAPGDLVCYMSENMYAALLSELAISTPAAFTLPGVIQAGRLAEYMGVRLVVGARSWAYDTPKASVGTSYGVAFVMRGKRAVTFAPKREVLLESEKDTTERDLKITASHTLAVAVPDPKEIVEILTSA